MRRFRNKMILIVFFSMVSVFAAVAIVANISASIIYSYQADGLTRVIMDNDGELPKVSEFYKFDVSEDVKTLIGYNEESAYRTRYFTAEVSEDTGRISMDYDHIMAINSEKGSKMVRVVQNMRASRGYYEHFRYLKVSASGVTRMVFLDCTESFRTLNMMTIIILAISGTLTLLVTLVVIMFSNRVLRPFEENANRQKQFITDASHELKTPLAIISANSEVLQYKHGENEWTKNIIAQTKRMGELINQLLTLAKSEEIEDNRVITEIDFKELVEGTMNNFVGIFEQKDVSINTVMDEAKILGDYEQIKQTVSILMENASKYVLEKGELDVILKNNDRNVMLQIGNTSDISDDVEFDRLFDRFYRPEQSRNSSKGGYGIGLSVAKNVIQQHNGTIKAKKVGDKVVFTATLPAHRRKKRVRSTNK